MGSFTGRPDSDIYYHEEAVSMAKQAREAASKSARQVFDIHVSYGNQKAEELLTNSLRGILRVRPDLLNNTHNSKQAPKVSE